MLITCWSVKGGSGVSVVAAAMAGLMARRHGSAVLVDLGGDQGALHGLPEPSGPGVCDWAASEAPAEKLALLTLGSGSEVMVLPPGDAPPVGTLVRAKELAAAAATLAEVVVVDAGRPLGAHPEQSEHPGSEAHLAVHLRNLGTSLFVTRACYLSLRRARATGVDADGVVLLDEPGRALGARDVSEVLGLPVIGVVDADPEVARAVDAGTLSRRIPRTLSRGLRRAG